MSLNPSGYGLQPGTYIAHRAHHRITTDGRAGDQWVGIPRTPRFVDMMTGEPAPMDTQAAILWDDEAMHIAFWISEPNVVATMTQRDDLLFFENDVEVFIDGVDSYYELEINALGNVYEVFYIWRDAYKPGGKWDVPRFNVHGSRARTFGGDFEAGPKSFWSGNHPRGVRWAFLDYDLPGLQVKVHVDGTINDPSDIDRGWSTEISVPWVGLADLANGRPLPPRHGDVWGIFLGRFQQLLTRSPGARATAGWSAHRFGVADTHVPECFTQVTFVDH